jgi:hypothetical protein
MAFLDSGNILVFQMKKGTLRKIENDYLLKEPLLGVTIATFNTMRAMYRSKLK